MLRSGAAVMVCVVSAVLAVVATVPAVKLRHAVREVVVAVLIATLGGLATVGLQPSLDVVRFDYVSLGLALVGSFGVVYRLGAGFHGLGRRGIFIVVVGVVVLGLTLAYAELLARYGTPALVEWVFDAIRWLRETVGASPRPIVALLGIPALVWGTHMRARRRQGWWVCAFGVGATAPIAQALVDPTVTREESALAIGYGVLIGLAVGVAPDPGRPRGHRPARPRRPARRGGHGGPSRARPDRGVALTTPAWPGGASAGARVRVGNG